MKNFFQTICDNFWTIFGQFFFSNCAISCDIKGVIKNPGGIQGCPGGLKGIPKIQGRPIGGDLVDLGGPGGGGPSWPKLQYTPILNNGHLKACYICNIELSIKDLGGRRPEGPGRDPGRLPGFALFLRVLIFFWQTPLGGLL